MTSQIPTQRATLKKLSAATRSLIPIQNQYSSPADAAFVERHSAIATANEIRPLLHRAKDGRFLVVPTVDSRSPVTDETDGVRTRFMEALTPMYSEEDCSPVDPAGLSFADSVRALGAYRKAIKVSTRHMDSLLFSIVEQVRAGDPTLNDVRPNTQMSAKRLVTGFYKARVSPELMLLTNSIRRAAQEDVDPKAAEDFLSEIVTLDPQCYDEFQQFLDFKRVRQVDQDILGSANAGEKDPIEVSALLHADRQKRIAQVATESKATRILHDSSTHRFFGDTLRTVARPTKGTSSQIEPSYVKTLLSCLGGEDTAQAETVTDSGGTSAVTTGSQPGPGNASAPGNQPGLVSSFNADAVRKFLARDLPVKEDGTFIDSVQTYVME